jgi:hypothetical protein
VRGSCDGRTIGMFDETTMAEPWDGVGIAAMAGTHMAQEGASGWVRCDAHTGSETSVGMLQAR